MGAVPAAARPAHAIEKTAVRRAIALRLNRKGPTGGDAAVGRADNGDFAWVGFPLFEQMAVSTRRISGYRAKRAYYLRAFSRGFSRQPNECAGGHR